MVEVPKFGRLQKTINKYKQRLVVDAKGIYILHYSMMMMLQMPELPFTSAQFVPTSQSHMNVVRAHTSSPIPRRAKIRPGVPTWARWPIIDLCMAIAMIQYRGSQQWDLGDVYTIIILCQFNQLQKNARSNYTVNNSHPIDISYINTYIHNILVQLLKYSQHWKKAMKFCWTKNPTTTAGCLRSSRLRCPKL